MRHQSRKRALSPLVGSPDVRRLRIWRKQKPIDLPHLYDAFAQGMRCFQADSFDKAEAFFMEAGQGFEVQVGPLDRRTLQSMRNWALSLQSKGDVRLAEVLYRETLRRYEMELGVADSETMNVREDLARTLRLRGWNDEAVLLFEESVAYLVQIYGPNSPLVLGKKLEFAGFLEEQGMLIRAEKLCREARDGFIKMKGLQDDMTFACNRRLFRILRLSGRADDGEPLYNELSVSSE